LDLSSNFITAPCDLAAALLQPLFQQEILVRGKVVINLFFS
jgi:hypothetical protein